MTDKHKTQQDGHSVGGSRRGQHTQLAYVLLAAVVNAAAYFFLFYFVELFNADPIAALIGLILLNALFGFVIGRWWSLLLPVTMVLVSFLYLTNMTTLDLEIIIYFLVPIAVASIAGGVVIRWFIERSRE